MRIMISPAKKMNEVSDGLPWRQLPQFVDRAEQLVARLRELSDSELQHLWRCNDQLAQLNRERLRRMDLRQRLTPALLAYEGIQYQYMAPGVFTETQFAYVEEHLRILSGLYGLLRPFDGVTPYRLEMQARLSGSEYRSLYAFWDNSLAEQLGRETEVMINLASQEYSRCVTGHLPPHVRCVTCLFGAWSEGRVIEKGTLCKMARGEMVRFMAETGVSEVEQLKGFTRQHYRFSAEHSDEETYVFLREEPERREAETF